MTVMHTQHLIAHFLPTPSFHPQLCGLNHRHGYLLSTATVHLLADDIFNIAKDPQPEGQPSIKTAGKLTNHARAQHQFMANDICVGRIFF